MRRSVFPLLQLIRLPNVAAAGADSLAGWLLVGGALNAPARWLPLVGASMSLYAAGMALNDWFDVEVDRLERPGRPLPSGRVSPRVAAGIGWGGLALGLLLAAAGVGGAVATLIVAALLATTIVGYNAGLKHTVLGPEVMGSCRGLNMLLGMSAAPALGGPAAWLAAGSFGLFVAGVTWISRSEMKTGETRNLLIGLALQNLAFLGLAGAALSPRRFPTPPVDPPLIPVEGLLVLVVVALTVNLAASRALREPSPRFLQGAVKTGVLSLVWIDVALVASIRGPQAALAVALFWPPAFVLARWLYST
ncbi:MAG: UbiA family prenyltransferase [Paludisphaera borealis]|uniref:UbiA family prenyltransferase n=1 Tax=Paludisphaera borealis TaxID=1387353 RepID=UPI00283F0B11|nr:UbiA family prenyltransferase [Paludisphaera borealis]MDR3623018.1 UbiA family prenyltransferase [Paludisphaera borealis]